LITQNKSPATLENTGFYKTRASKQKTNKPRCRKIFPSSRMHAIQFSKFALDIILIFARRPFMARAFVFFVNR
jgi:hypothetical protein